MTSLEESTARLCLARLLLTESRAQRPLAQVGEKIDEVKGEPERFERILNQLKLAKQRQDLVKSFENYAQLVHLAPNLNCQDSTNKDKDKAIEVIRNIQIQAQEQRDRTREALDLICEITDCYQE